MNNWFSGCASVAAIKTRYRELAKRYHPDVTHDKSTTPIMQEINAAYHSALESVDGQSYRGDDQQEHTYHYNSSVEQAIMDKIVELLKLHMPDVRILLVGTWVWVLGDTRPHKEALKELGLWWNGRREAWSYHVGPWRGRASSASLAGLATTYGVAESVRERMRR